MKGVQPEHLKVRARFRSEAEILAAIDKKMEQVKRLREQAAGLAQEASVLVRRGRAACAHLLRDDAYYLHARADKLEARRLAGLKRKLSEIRTMLLPGCGTDESIPK